MEAGYEKVRNSFRAIAMGAMGLVLLIYLFIYYVTIFRDGSLQRSFGDGKRVEVVLRPAE